ncbi:MAG: hypothetical protein JKP92_05420 [Alphaproteobacteria bacterium]|nr:hypothetical protein [Alphaproteobacteria bacterium]
MNKEEKFVIFGAWRHEYDEKIDGTVILGEDWDYRKDGKKNSAYEESRDNIDLIEKHGYKLKIFRMWCSKENVKAIIERGESAEIERFEEKLEETELKTTEKEGKKLYFVEIEWRE